MKGIVASPGLGGAVGFIFVPLIAAIAAVPAGIWGLAVGHVVLSLRGDVVGPRALFWSAAAAAASLPAGILYGLWLTMRA